MVTAGVSIIPVGSGTNISKVVRKFVELLRKNGVKVIPGPVSTAIEAKSTKKIFEAIDKAHNELFGKEVKRVVINIQIDDRRDKSSTLEYKQKSIEE